MRVAEPPIGWRVVEESGHWWYHDDDGDWYCSCGDSGPFEWPDVVEDIGRAEIERATFVQVSSPVEPQ